ncbi:DUF63 family protein [Methanocrinis sp.]|uniref:DUF63 family protein n=1 Tax=Methanocrinis sp. TaxID=3101522 RepID=UPI003D1367E4
MHPWIYEYYIDPIISDSGYNPVNTVTWALILGGMLLLIIGLFRRLEVRLDERLVFCTVPYILAGASLRVVEDADLVAAPAKYLLITPFIYFLVAAVTLASLILCRGALKERYLSGYALVGLLWTGANLLVLSTQGTESLSAPVAIFSLGSAATLAAVAAASRLKLRFLSDRLNLLILYAHLLDASSTFVGVDWFGYTEKHVLPTFLIELAGTALVMYPLKLLILVPILALIDDALRDDPTLKNLTKLALLTLGLAPALRNTLRLTLGI